MDLCPFCLGHDTSDLLGFRPVLELLTFVKKGGVWGGGGLMSFEKEQGCILLTNYIILEGT